MTFESGQGRLAGTVALVTGASSGIGAATAVSLAAAGAQVALVARRKDRMDALAASIGSAALVIEADVSNEEQIRSAVEQTVRQFGRLDTVVANAGLMLLGPIVDADVTEWSRMVELNLLGLMYTAHASLPHLLDAATKPPREVADLVLISSVAGRVARLGNGGYTATKHGVGAFGEALRQEVAERHVRVSLIEPGAVNTELASHNRPEVLAGMASRFGNIERMEDVDIADAINYVVTRPRRMSINELLVRPTQQQG